MTEPAMRVQIWIDAVMVVDNLVTMTNVGFLAEQDIELVAAADKAGMKWLVQVTDPDDPDAEQLRFGSDTGGMVMPIPLDLRDLGKWPR